MHDIAHAAADAARVPNFDDVLAKGRRHRSRRQGLAVGAAAVAVATIVGVTQVVGGGSEGPPEPAPSPTIPTGSAATIIPYWTDGTLHVGDVAIETDHGAPVYAGGTTVVGNLGAETPSKYYLVDGSDLVPIAESDTVMGATLSRDGRLVVLLEFPSEGSQRLTAWDVDSRSEVASVDLPVDDPSSQLLVVGIDLDHRVFLSDERTSALMWVPGEDPVPVTGVAASALGTAPWPGGLAHERRKGPRNTGISTSLGDGFGTVDDGGRYTEVGTVSPGIGTWSPDGEIRVGIGSRGMSEGLYDVEYADGRQSASLELPDPGFWQVAAWESDTQLVLYLFGDQPDPDIAAEVDDLARCDVVTLTCTRIEEVPDGSVQWASGGGRY